MPLLVKKKLWSPHNRRKIKWCRLLQFIIVLALELRGEGEFGTLYWISILLVKKTKDEHFNHHFSMRQWSLWLTLAFGRIKINCMPSQCDWKKKILTQYLLFSVWRLFSLKLIYHFIYRTKKFALYSKCIATYPY